MKKYNCPNCGAPITDEKCPYCGTVIYDFACLDMDHPTYLKIKHNGRIIMAKALFRECEITHESHEISCQQLDDTCMRRTIGLSAEVNLNFIVLSDEDGVLFKVVDI